MRRDTTRSCSVRLKGLALAVAVTVQVLAGGVQQSASAAPQFLLPFTCGETWQARTWTGHNPADAVDLNFADQQAEVGKPVRASAPGTVTLSLHASGGYGNEVVVDHGGGWTTRYAHLASRAVTVGQTVSAGQQLGVIGNTSDVSIGVHLHYEQIYQGVVQKAVLEGTRLPYYNATVSLTSTNCSPAGPVSSDVTGDRKDDLLGMKDGRLYLHRNNGAGDFGAGEVRLDRGYNRDWLGTADMGGKGLVSVLGRSNGRLYRYLNNGSGDFGASQVMLAHGYNYTQLFTGDYNRDGYTDLFGMNSGKLSVFVNNKANDFASATLLGDRGYNRDWLGAADINGDGYDDILGRTNGRLYVYTNNKTGDFGASRLLADHGYNYETLLTADINNDGKDDVLGETAGTLYAFKSTGTDFGARTQLGPRGYNYTTLIS
jgi:biotin carboxyl carrier protein